MTSNRRAKAAASAAASGHHYSISLHCVPDEEVK